MVEWDKMDRRDAIGLFLLRIGCAWFIFVWAVNKFTAPGQYAFVVKRFDGLDVVEWQVFAIGAVQILVCLMVFAGLFRTWSYAALAVIHGGTLFRIWERLIEPFAVNDKGFPVNRNSAVALAVFLAMVALWLLRHRDRWSVDHWLAQRVRG